MQGMGDKQKIQRIARQKLILHTLAPHLDFDVDVGGGGKERNKEQVVQRGTMKTRWITKIPVIRDGVRMLRDQEGVKFRYGPAVIPDRRIPQTFHDMVASRIARSVGRRYEKVVADLEQMREGGLVGRLSDGIWTANPAKFQSPTSKE